MYKRLISNRTEEVSEHLMMAIIQQARNTLDLEVISKELEGMKCGKHIYHEGAFYTYDDGVEEKDNVYVVEE